MSGREFIKNLSRRLKFVEHFSESIFIDIRGGWGLSFGDGKLADPRMELVEFGRSTAPGPFLRFLGPASLGRLKVPPAEALVVRLGEKRTSGGLRSESELARPIAAKSKNRLFRINESRFWPPTIQNWLVPPNFNGPNQIKVNQKWNFPEDLNFTINLHYWLYRGWL